MFFDIILKPCSKVTECTFEVTEACSCWLFLAEEYGMAEIRIFVIILFGNLIGLGAGPSVSGLSPMDQLSVELQVILM